MLVGINQEIGIGLVLISSNTTSQLMHVGKPISIRFIDKDGVGIGDVQTAFDNCCCEQHIKLVVDKVSHHLFKFAFRHLGMANHDAGLRDNSFQPILNDPNIANSVMNEVDLPVAIEFSKKSMPNQFVAPACDACFDIESVLRR